VFEKMETGKEADHVDVTIYFAKWCGTCKKTVPYLVGLAEKVGLSVELIDVDDVSNKDLCSHIKWVPFFEQDGSEISVQEFLQLISELAKKED
jgi:thiol-disulfide isomerase/thioredoxin